VVKLLRMLHLYLGVFAAPALLFFAFTGGLQTFSLHETTRGSSYTPPAMAGERGTIAQEGNDRDAGTSRSLADCTRSECGDGR